MSETAPKLEHADVIPDPESELPSPPTPVSETPDASQEDTKAPETEEACVVLKEDLTPKGRRMADEAREVAAAHASLLVDIEACKRVSMSRRLPLSFLCLCCFMYVWYWNPIDCVEINSILIAHLSQSPV